MPTLIEVSIFVNTDNIYRFAVWDTSSETLTLDASVDDEANLYRATVTLDDG